MKLSVIEHGVPSSSAPFVVIPGITSPAFTWDFIAARLAASRHVAVIDTRGRGDSPRAAGGYDLRTQAADVTETLVNLNLPTPVLIGHSLGARIAAEVAASRELSLAGLVLVDPPATEPGAPAYVRSVDFYFDQLRAVERSGDDGLRAFYPTWSPARLRERCRALRQCTPEAIVGSYAAMHALPIAPTFLRVVEPTLVLYGADSAVLAASDAERLAALLTHAVAEAVPGAGHMVPWDNLEGFLAALDAFVSREIAA